MMDWKERGGGMEGGRQRFRRPRLRSFGISLFSSISPLVGRQIKEGLNHRKDGSGRRFNGMIWG